MNARRWRRRIALLLALNLSIMGVDAVVTFNRTGSNDVDTVNPRTTGSAEREAQVEALLQSRGTAILKGDRAAFLASVDPSQKTFYARQAALFDNLRTVPIGQWRYVLDPKVEETEYPSKMSRYNAPVWVPLVTLTYTLAGYDKSPALLIERFTFVQRSGRWLIGNDDDFTDGGSPSGRGIWDYGTVVKAATPNALVLGHPRSAARLKDIANLAEDAVAHVSSVWGKNWSRKVVVLVPDTQDELSAIISEGSDLSEIAAVAVAQNAGGRTPGNEFGDRIILNPKNFDELSAIGRKVILRHEVTHVATRSVTGSIAPTWLTEGMADYIGYRDAGIAVPTVAHELAVDVKAGYRPTELPTDDKFASFSPKLAQAYEQAWLACRLIVTLKGEPALVKFYRQVGLSRADNADQAVDKAVQSVLGMSYAKFLQLWRDNVVRELT